MSVSKQVRIGIAMDEVAYADDRVVFPAVEAAFGEDRVTQWDPPHDTGDAVVCGGDLEHQLGVFALIGGLYQDDSNDAGGVEFRVDVTQVEASVERGRVDEPGVVHSARIPDVDVAVDHRLDRVALRWWQCHRCAHDGHAPMAARPDANTSSIRLIAVCRWLRIAVAARSGSPLAIASAMISCSTLVAAP